MTMGSSCFGRPAQFLRAARELVGLQQIRDEVDVRPGSEAARLVLGHRTLHRVEQFPDGLAVPVGHERIEHERRGFPRPGRRTYPDRDTVHRNARTAAHREPPGPRCRRRPTPTASPTDSGQARRRRPRTTASVAMTAAVRRCRYRVATGPAASLLLVRGARSRAARHQRTQERRHRLARRAAAPAPSAAASASGRAPPTPRAMSSGVRPCLFFMSSLAPWSARYLTTFSAPRCDGASEAPSCRSC